MAKIKRYIEIEIREALYQTFVRGETFNYFQKKFYTDVLSGKLKTDKLELIYNIYNALMNNALRYNSFVQNYNSRPYLRYHILGTNCENEICKFLNDKVVHVNSTFWNEFAPPNHTGCYAMVTALTEDEVKNKGLEVLENPQIEHPNFLWSFNPAKTNLTGFIEGFINLVIKNRIVK